MSGASLLAGLVTAAAIIAWLVIANPPCAEGEHRVQGWFVNGCSR